ncbi:MAG TPA: hypothetical protein VF836_12980, partial [Gemmatimonadaceae bacterium]
ELTISAGQSGEGFLTGATLAWSESLTTLPRSARSRVSSSRSFAAAYEDTLTSLPSGDLVDRIARVSESDSKCAHTSDARAGLAR